MDPYTWSWNPEALIVIPAVVFCGLRVRLRAFLRGAGRDDLITNATSMNALRRWLRSLFGSKQDSRSEADRRASSDRRSGRERRAARDAQLAEDRRSGADRRSGRDRRDEPR